MPTISTPPQSLDGISFCFVATGGFGAVWPTWKRAGTLADAGAVVYIVGYRDAIPSLLAGSGHSVVAAERPIPREAPVPPSGPIAPELPPPAVWHGSSSRSRLVRAVMNRTVNRAAFAMERRRQEREHERQTRENQLRFEEELKACNEALEAFWSDYVPPPWYEWQSHPTLVEAVVQSGSTIIQAIDLSALDVAAHAAEKIGAKLVYAMDEFWTGFVRNPDSPASPEDAVAVLEVERRRIQEADLVTVVSDPMGERIATMYDLPRPLTIFNSPAAKVDEVRPVSDPVKLVFHGGLSRDRNLEALIRAVGILRDSVTLDILGSDRTAHADELKSLIDELELGDRVRLRGAFDYPEIVDLISEYDLGVMAARVVDENFELALPTKVFDCMCAGLAIAMTDSAAIRAILDEVPFGITLDATSPETIARDLEQLVSDPGRIGGMKAAAVEAAPRYWWPEQGRKLVDALRPLVRSLE